MAASSGRCGSTSSRPLLAAKQQVPQVARAAVEREHLLARIGGHGATRLTVVVAPAGWGKSTLLAQWACRPLGPRRVAWVSLDPSDDEPGRFWAYLLSALGAVAPELVRRPQQALVAADVDPVDVVLPTLLNELAATADRLALVLDDYHVISDPRIHEQLEFLLSYLPPALHVGGGRPSRPGAAAGPAPGSWRADRAARCGPAVARRRGNRAAGRGRVGPVGRRRDRGARGADRRVGRPGCTSPR